MTLPNLFKYKETHILLAFLFSFLLVVDKGYFPYFSVFLFFSIYISISYFLTKSKTKFTHILFILGIVLSAFVFIKTNPVLTFLNITALIYIQAILILNSKINYFSDIVFAVLQSLEVLLVQKDLTESLIYNKILKKKNIKIDLIPILFGLIITIICTVFLLGANPIFDTYVKNLGKLFTDTWVLWIIRVIFSLLLAVISFRVYSAVTNKNTKSYLEFSKNTFVTITGVFLVVLVFIWSQLQFYTLSGTALEIIGYSRSRYTREIFAQMIAVSTLIVGCVFFNSNKNKYIKILSILTILEGFVLLAFGMRSDVLYIQSWGLTIKRLYGLVAIYIIFSTNILFLIKEKIKQNFAQMVLINVLTTLLLVNIINFDYLISIYSPKTENGKDYEYISKLSLDAGLGQDFLNEINKQMEKDYLYVKENIALNKIPDLKIEGWEISDVESGYYCISPNHKYFYSKYFSLINAYENWIDRTLENERKYLEINHDIRLFNISEYFNVVKQNFGITKEQEIGKNMQLLFNKRLDIFTSEQTTCGRKRQYPSDGKGWEESGSFGFAINK